MQTIKHNSGYSLVELVLAIAIFAIVVSSVLSVVFGSLTSFGQAGDMVSASALVDETVEGVLDIALSNFNEIIFTQSAVGLSGERWSMLGEGSEKNVSKFYTTAYFFPVYRNPSFDLVDWGEEDSFEDVMMTRVIASSSWLNVRGSKNSVVREIYVAAWNAVSWEQGDWAGGPGQSIWSLADKYDSDSGDIDSSVIGELRLSEIATGTYSLSESLISSAYDSGDQSSFISIEWNNSLEAGGNIKFQIQTATDSAGSPGAWSGTWCGPEGEDGDGDDFFTTEKGTLIHTDHNSDQWIRYKAVLTSGGTSTPALSNVKIYYQ